MIDLLNYLYPFTLDITTTINEFLEKYITIITDMFDGLSVYLQAGILVILAIFVIYGLFKFIKKFFVLFLVLAVLGAAFWYIYTNGYLDSIFPNQNATIINSIFKI